MKRLLMLFFISSMLFAQNGNNNPEITKKEILDHISYFASDEMEGRFTGSEKCYEAANYIAEEYKQYGVEPLFEGKYFQGFDFIEDIELGDNNAVKLNIGGDEKVLKLNEDFVTAPFSGKGKIEAPLFFAGYGISADKLEYNDYADADVKGKIVVIMRYNPESDNPHTEFEKYSSLRLKASTAQSNGAVGMILVNGHKPSEEDKFIKFRYDRAAGIKGFPVVHVNRNFITLLFESEGLDFASVQTVIDTTKSPNSFLFKNASAMIQTEVKEIHKTGRNVGAILKAPNGSNEYVVIGAHYDHLGYGKTGSLYRGKEPKVHNGADDNASGTVGVLELAEKFAHVKDQLKRNIIFLNFSGEELGLLGSNYFVNNSPVPLENITAMINMDMIGRLDSTNQLTIFGTGTSSIWKDILTEKNQYGLTLTFNDDGYGPSDHASFYGKKIPALHFFTGTHADYHRPSDDVEKINEEGEKIILDFIYDFTFAIANNETRPDYVYVERKEGTRGGWKVYVGTIPDYGNTDGFKLSGVSPNSPAEKAGLKGGDIMLQFGDRKVNNIYDFVYALQDHVPGDVVQVVVKRNGEVKTLELVLGAK